MKQISFLAFLPFLCILFVSAQDVIENPEKPLNKSAGRALELKEELRITDKSGDYYFRAPSNLRISSDGSIFISDSYGNNFLKFSSDGKYIKNLYKKGAGPGEIQDYFDYSLSHEKIFVYDNVKSKLIVMKDDGDLIDEIKFETDRFADLYGIYKDDLVFLKRNYPSREDRKSSRFYEIQNIIVLVSTDGKMRRESQFFLNKIFLIASSLGGGLLSWDPLDVVLDENTGYLYVSCTREYMIRDEDNFMSVAKYKVIEK